MAITNVFPAKMATLDVVMPGANPDSAYLRRYLVDGVPGNQYPLENHIQGYDLPGRMARKIVS